MKGRTSLTETRAPLVSVVMPVYNGEKFLSEAIESVLAQTFADFEFIIVDDGSSDRSAQIVRSYAKSETRIRFIQQERNLGHADARNRGHELATGEYIAVMDCDDICLPRRLETQIDFLRRNPAIGALGAGAQAVAEDRRPLFKFDLPEEHALIALNLFVGSFLIHPTVMMRRETLESVGGYESSRRTAVDTELWSRLIWRTRFANLPEQLLLYRWHEGQNHRMRATAMRGQAWQPRERLLKRLWGEAPQEALHRFERMRQDKKLGRRARQTTREDLARLLDAFLAAGIINPGDLSLVAAHIDRRLEATTPRLWQMLLHWRRHHFGR